MAILPLQPWSEMPHSPYLQRLLQNVLPSSSEDQILIPLLKDNEAASVLFSISSIMSFIAGTFGVVALNNQQSILTIALSSCSDHG